MKSLGAVLLIAISMSFMLLISSTAIGGLTFALDPTLKIFPNQDPGIDATPARPDPDPDVEMIPGPNDQDPGIEIVPDLQDQDLGNVGIDDMLQEQRKR